MVKLNKRLIGGVVCIIGLFISGCDPGLLPSDPVVQSDLIGKYQGKVEPFPGRYLGLEKLTLRSTGKYEQVFIASTGRITKNVGTWELEHGPPVPIIRLVDAVQYLSPWRDRIAATIRHTDMYIPIYKHGKSIQLVVGEDSYLSKIN